jgi:hypothetical protein
LIKVRGRLGEFDGEEGSDAGVEVEGFTGQAGSDGFGFGVLKAVHRSQPILPSRIVFGRIVFGPIGFGRSLGASAGEVEMLGQILIIHPRLARLSIRLLKLPTVGFTGDGDPALMNHRVMPLTEQDQIANTAATRT